MFDDENYAGCTNKLKEFNKICSDIDLLKESTYLLIASDYRQGKKDVLYSLRDYLEENPETIHRDDIYFMISSCYFEQKDYSRSTLWFEQTNINNLSKRDQEDYAYRMAFSSLQKKKYDESYRLFRLLNENSEKYQEASIYYLAYIYYSKNEFNTAIKFFNQLKENQEYKLESLFYITQINFAQGHYTQTIKDGKELLATFPENSRNAELNRIIGISYVKADAAP